MFSCVKSLFEVFFYYRNWEDEPQIAERLANLRNRLIIEDNFLKLVAAPEQQRSYLEGQLGEKKIR